MSDDGDRLGLERRYAGALSALLVQMTPPYGFTLATFTAGGLTAHFAGTTPDPWDILLFLAGALTGYALLALIAVSLLRRLHPRPLPVNSWQMLHVIPLGVVFLLALAAATLVAFPVAWFMSGIALTFGYLGSFAWVLRFLGRDDGTIAGGA